MSIIYKSYSVIPIGLWEPWNSIYESLPQTKETFRNRTHLKKLLLLNKFSGFI